MTRRVLVTTVANGSGRATARQLAATGWGIEAMDRDAAGLAARR
jgi:NAD(P)-dependent dehydrogenase (short-subunit alcohol dehydrogenase family)